MLALRVQRIALVGFALAALLSACGCHSLVHGEPRNFGPQIAPPLGDPAPTEKEKTSLPAYTIEPPDILFIEVVRLVPKPPYHIQATDTLSVEMEGLFSENAAARQPLSGRFGRTHRPGTAIRQGQSQRHDRGAGGRSHPPGAVEDQQGTARLGATRLVQRFTAGDRSAPGRPDGTVNLGTYGQVYVSGMTMEEATEAIRVQLAKFLDAPQVSVSVYAYNSKVYYVITEGAGSGDQVARLPITGNETVLDAISQINGLSRLSSKNVWIARPRRAAWAATRSCRATGKRSPKAPPRPPTTRSCRATACSSPRTS